MAASSGSLDTSANSHHRHQQPPPPPPTASASNPTSSFPNSIMSSGTATSTCPPSTFFTDLLSSDDYPPAAAATSVSRTRGLADRIAERTGSGVPTFKSIPRPSLPISPPIFSPSSYFAIPPGLSPAELLDSPVLLSSSNILPSPTTGTFPFQAFNWKSNYSENKQQVGKQEQKNLSDFSFQPQTNSIPSKSWDHLQEPKKQEVLSSGNSTVMSELSSAQSFSPEISTIQKNPRSNDGFQPDHNNNFNQSSQSLSERRRSEDGYNWRKYGQKQVKGSENPRSYYKCTHPNCPTKKKVERSLDGQITEIVYKGNHNHPKPQSTRRSSSSAAAAAGAAVSQPLQPYKSLSQEILEQSYVSQGTGPLDSGATPENSSISVGDDDFNQQSSQRSRSGVEEFDEDEPDAKRWKSINECEGLSAPGNRTVREPRVVVQTTSDIDILDDGYRWRKYGQKVVKGNPNPRSYYKCTHTGCPVRKHVERAAQDNRSVITTYEGKHNHDVPAARGGGSQSINRPVPDNNGGGGSSGMLGMIRPSPMINPISRQPASGGGQSHLEMLHGTVGGFGYSGYENPIASYMNQSQINDSVFSKTKEEPRENMLLESLLC